MRVQGWGFMLGVEGGLLLWGWEGHTRAGTKNGNTLGLAKSYKLGLSSLSPKAGHN